MEKFIISYYLNYDDAIINCHYLSRVLIIKNQELRNHDSNDRGEATKQQWTQLWCILWDRDEWWDSSVQYELNCFENYIFSPVTKDAKRVHSSISIRSSSCIIGDTQTRSCNRRHLLQTCKQFYMHFILITIINNQYYEQRFAEIAFCAINRFLKM